MSEKWEGNSQLIDNLPDDTKDFFYILRELERIETPAKCNPNNINNRIGVKLEGSRHTVEKLLSEMEENGLVINQQEDENSTHRYSLTTEGEAILETIRPLIDGKKSAIVEKASNVFAGELKERYNDPISPKGGFISEREEEVDNRTPIQLKNEWKEGKFDDELIRKIAIGIDNPNKGTMDNESYVENLILENLPRIVEEAWSDYQNWLDKKREEKRRREEREKKKLTEEIEVDEIVPYLELQFENIVFAFFRNPTRSVNEGIESIEEGKYDDLLEKYTAEMKKLKPDHEAFEDKFKEAKTRALENVKEEIEENDVPWPQRQPIITDVSKREEMIGTFVYWAMKEKVKNDGKEILAQWREGNIDWQYIRDKTKEIMTRRWNVEPEEIGFRKKFDKTKENVLDFTLQKHG